MQNRITKKRQLGSLVSGYAFITSKLSNAEPILSYPVSDQVPAVAYVDEEYSFEIAGNTMLSSLNSATDITYKAFDLPSWLSFDGTTFSGTPKSADYSGSDSSIDQNTLILQGYDSNDDSYLNTTVTLSLLNTQTVSVSSDFNINSFLSGKGDITGDNGYILTPNTAFSLEFDPSDFVSSSSSDSLIYGAKMEYGNSPLPIWLTFDDSSLTFSGTAPTVNSEIAAAQSYSIVLYATSEAEISMAEINFSLVIGAHSLSIEDADISINTTSSQTSFSYSFDMSNIKLDGESVSQDNISAVELSSDAPSWATLSHVGSLNYVISGTVPSGFSSETFQIQVFDSFSDQVNYNVDIKSITPISSSTSSTSTTTSSSSSSTSSAKTSSSASSTTTSKSSSSASSTTSSLSTSSAKISTTTLKPTSSAESFSTTTSKPSSSSSSSSTATSSSTASVLPTSVISKTSHKKNNHTTAIVCGVVIPVVVILLLLLLLLFVMKRRRSNQKPQSSEPASPNSDAKHLDDGMDLEKTAPLVLTKTTSLTSSHSSKSNYEKNYDKSTNDINAEALNGIPTGAELDKNIQNFLQDTSHTESEIADSSNTTNSTSMYSPIRHSQSSLENQNLYYQSMKNKGKESWRNITENNGAFAEDSTQQWKDISKEQPVLSSQEKQASPFRKSDRSDNRSSYHTLNSIGTDEFMAMDLKPDTPITVNEDSHRKASLLNVRDSVFINENDNTILLDDQNGRPDLLQSKKSSMLVPFENVDSSVTKGDITDGQSIETASL